MCPEPLSLYGTLWFFVQRYTQIVMFINMEISSRTLLLFICLLILSCLSLLSYSIFRVFIIAELAERKARDAAKPKTEPSTGELWVFALS